MPRICHRRRRCRHHCHNRNPGVTLCIVIVEKIWSRIHFSCRQRIYHRVGTKGEWKKSVRTMWHDENGLNVINIYKTRPCVLVCRRVAESAATLRARSMRIAEKRVNCNIITHACPHLHYPYFLFNNAQGGIVRMYNFRVRRRTKQANTPTPALIAPSSV